jgi:hypothetical protein
MIFKGRDEKFKSESKVRLSIDFKSYLVFPAALIPLLKKTYPVLRFKLGISNLKTELFEVELKI